MTVEEKLKYKEYKKKYLEAEKQRCNYIDIFIKNNGENMKYL